MAGKKIIDFKSWGKHFLICFKGFTLRIHFMLFGSYRINDTKDAVPRLSLIFTNGELNFYACSVKLIGDDLDEIYDWTADVMSDSWDEKAARKKLKTHPDMLVCDALLNQHIFAGVGNIIKNEVLFRIRVHPGSRVGALPTRKLSELIKEARIYSFQFMEGKRNMN
jgi:endonuclease-8